MHDRTNPSPVQAMPPAKQRGPVLAQEQQRTSVPPTSAPALWTTSSLDPDETVAELGGRYPHSTIWFGEFTGSYWALIRTKDGTARIVEGNTPADLGRQLDSLDLRTPRDDRPQHTAEEDGDSIRLAWCTGGKYSSARRPSRGRGRCRRRHIMPKALSRSGRC